MNTKPSLLGKTTVVGAGAWGTALACLLAEISREVWLWAYEPEVVEDINHRRQNQLYLPQIELPTNLRASGDFSEALVGGELVLMVVPSHVLRQVARQAAEHLPAGVPLVCATKGIENDTLLTPAEILEEVLPIVYHPMLAFLSGPSFAREVARRQPTAVSVAARFEKVAERVQQLMSTSYFRIYTTTDVMGVELGGALKNVIAIAAGAADGLGLGSNAVAALVTRGLAEISRLAVKRGANPLTLSGLSGMGDLVLTCYGELSRNRMVGQKLGRGERASAITSGMRQVAEGVRTSFSVHQLAQREGVEMPICEVVYRMLYQDLEARQAVASLMGRSLKREIY